MASTIRARKSEGWKLRKIILFAVFAIILACPLAVLGLTSQAEMSQYQEPERVEWTQQAYGDIYEAHLGNIYEGAAVTGEYVPCGQELIRQEKKQTEQVLTVVSKGDEVREGQILAYIGTREIKSPIAGVFEKTESDDRMVGFVLKKLTDPVLEVRWPDDLPIQAGQELTDDQDKKYQVDAVSKISSDHAVTIQLRAEGTHAAGEKFGAFLRNGNVQEDSMIIRKACVYQKSPGGTCFVSVVTAEGEFLEERKVTTGMQDSENINIIGLEEGEFCDAGYAQLMIPFAGGTPNESAGD